MNKTETSQILGKHYPKENIKYSYTGEKIRYKKFLVYPPIIILVLFISKSFVINEIVSRYSGSLLDNWENIWFFVRLFDYSIIAVAICFIALFFIKASCVFLKVKNVDKDIVIYKTIHKNEAKLLAEEINEKIKQGNFTSYP